MSSQDEAMRVLEQAVCELTKLALSHVSTKRYGTAMAVLRQAAEITVMLKSAYDDAERVRKLKERSGGVE